MKQNPRRKAFVAFCVFSGQTLLPNVRVSREIAIPKSIFARHGEFDVWQASTTTDQTDITDTVWSFVICNSSFPKHPRHPRYPWFSSLFP
jgi:hypothetical protein